MKYNTLGDRLIAKAKEFDPTYQPDRHNDLDEAVAILLDNMGGDGGTFIVETNEYMNSSTLPTILVPKLSAQQVAQIITNVSAGKSAVIRVGDIGVFTVEEVDIENASIKVTYYDYFLTYTEEGENTTVAYAQLGGTKLYKHTINTESGVPIIIISTDSRPFPIMLDELVQEYGFEWDNSRPFYSSSAGGYYADPTTVLKMTYDGAPLEPGANLIGPMVCVPSLNGQPVRLNSSSADVVTAL